MIAFSHVFLENIFSASPNYLGFVSLAEWSKALRSGRNIFGCKSSNLLAHNSFLHVGMGL